MAGITINDLVHVQTGILLFPLHQYSRSCQSYIDRLDYIIVWNGSFRDTVPVCDRPASVVCLA